MKKGHHPYLIAELSANHNGSLDRALRTVEAAALSGADAIKLQTYTADTMTIKSDLPDFQIEGGLWDGYSLYDLYERAHTPWDWHDALFNKAKECGIDCFSTPFDETAVDFLEKLNPPFYKIASFEMTDLPLLAYVAKTGRPIIMSTGLANVAEIEESVQCLRDNGCADITLLHCVSSYPAEPSAYNLMVIPDLMRRFGVSVGLSDHTLGVTTAITAVALGASVIEKHFTLKRTDGGPDAAFSSEPHELKELREYVDLSADALGRADYNLKPGEEANIRFRRSIYVVKPIRKGEKFSSENIRRIRPGLGMPCKFYDEILGKVATSDIAVGTPVREDHVG